MTDLSERISQDDWQGVGGRHTRQRQEIVAALRRQQQPVTAQELFLAIQKKVTKVSLATVYRTLNGLAKAGIIDTMRRQSGEAAYLCCGEGHHHHLSCRRCGRVVEIHDCELAEWAAKVGRRHRFSGIEHRAELTGVCAGCAGAKE